MIPVIVTKGPLSGANMQTSRAYPTIKTPDGIYTLVRKDENGAHYDWTPIRDVRP